MYFSYIKWSKTKDQMKKKRKNTKDKYNMSSLWRRGINAGIALSWLGGGIDLNIYVL